MRDIKFRAWNKTRAEMFNNPTEINWLNGKPKPVDTNWDWYKSEWVLLQYTGLKDKHGIEVYEGDILRDKDGMGEVEWMEEHCAFMIRVAFPHHTYFKLDNSGFNMKSTEIIGNIYENANLLKID